MDSMVNGFATQNEAGQGIVKPFDSYMYMAQHAIFNVYLSIKLKDSIGILKDWHRFFHGNG